MLRGTLCSFGKEFIKAALRTFCTCPTRLGVRNANHGAERMAREVPIIRRNASVRAFIQSHYSLLLSFGYSLGLIDESILGAGAGSKKIGYVGVLPSIGPRINEACLVKTLYLQRICMICTTRCCCEIHASAAPPSGRMDPF